MGGIIEQSYVDDDFLVGVCRGWRDAGHRVIETALTNACGGGDHVVSVAVVHRTPIVEHLVSGDQSVPMARVTFAPTLKRTEVIGWPLRTAAMSLLMAGMLG